MTKDYAKYRSTHTPSRSRAKPKSNASFVTTSIIVALCFGLVLGFGGSWLTNKSEDGNFFGKKETQKLAKEQTAPVKPRMRAEIEEIPPARFDFYTLLPNMDAESEEALASTAAASAPATQAQTQVSQPSTPGLTTAQSAGTPTTAGQPSSVAAAPTTQQTPTSRALQEALSPAPETKPMNSADLKLAFVIQAGSFKNQAAAEKLKAKLAFKGLQSKIETSSAQNGDIWYRVVIGPLASQAQAKSIQADLQSTENLNSLVLRVRV
ncbi:MAG: SPOR domain-containing protein [Gammaproteobacteria bacterium]